MAVTQYIGARYVPLFADPIDWDNTKHYEPLTIVYHQGNSFTSKQFVPTGIDITNTDYWALTGNYNAQVEQYRREVQAFDGRITANARAIADEVTARMSEDTAIRGIITDLQGKLSDEVQARTDADTALGTRIDNEAQARTSSDANLQGQLSDIRDSVAHVYQPIRPDKKDLLDIDPNDRNSPRNQPHVVRADDVSALASVPPGITSGPLYGLWDCYVMEVYEGGHAQILVTFREMVPVPGRVWRNWYNYQQWEGWKSVTPNTKVTTDNLADNAVTIAKLGTYYKDFNNIVLIGDSYGQGYTPDGNVNSWITLFKTLTTDYNYFSDASGGTGFVAKSNGFLQSLNKLISSMSADERIRTSKIIVAGGYNDRGNTMDAIYSGMKAFADAAKMAYPNARIYVAFIGNIVQGITTGVHSNTKYSELYTTDAYYNEACNKLGNVNYVVGARNVLQRKAWFSSDYVHPNGDGHYAIWYFLKNAIFYGTGSYYLGNHNYQQEVVEHNSDLFSGTDFKMWYTIDVDDKIPKVWFGGSNETKMTLKTRTTFKGHDIIKLGTVHAPCVTGTLQYNGGTVLVNYENGSTTDYYLAVPCVLMLGADGSVNMQLRYADTAGDYYTFTNVKSFAFTDLTNLHIN